MAGDEAANIVPDTPPADTFPAFTRNDAEDEIEGGLLYRQTRHPREGEIGEGSGNGAQGMEGSEDNAANWSRPSHG